MGVFTVFIKANKWAHCVGATVKWSSGGGT